MKAAQRGACSELSAGPPRKKQIFEEICAAHDLTPSQVVRKLIRQYIIENAGDRDLPDWLKGRSSLDRGVAP
jgi:hypothetical protein